MTHIVYPIFVLGGLGTVFGIMLAYASKVFFVPVDPTVEQLQNVLPGANCGACGYPGCSGLANALAEGKAPVNACPIGGQRVADLVAEILGSESAELEKRVAVVLCQGDCDKAKDKYIYEGIQDCRISNQLSDGQKSCSYGCLGCGTCRDVCQFDAIDMVNGVAIVNRRKMYSLFKMCRSCPKHIIEMVPYDSTVAVKCMSEDLVKLLEGIVTLDVSDAKYALKIALKMHFHLKII